jgi:hypothetical protein
MWLGISLAVGFSLALLAICYFAVEDRERQRERDGTALLGERGLDGRGSGASPAPLRRPASADQVVFEVERRIDAELAAIAGEVDASLARVFEPERSRRTR